jgi:REP element-mobilizing transposase RayT
MSTYTQILYQIVFGSYDYTPFLTLENEKIIFPYITVILKNKSCHPYIVGGASNHIHIITHIHPTLAPAYVDKDIKLASHKMIMQNMKAFPHFLKWQVGYSSFTYHIAAKNNLITYVENQRSHHKIVTFKQELIDLFNEHSVDYDERYLFT